MKKGKLSARNRTGRKSVSLANFEKGDLFGSASLFGAEDTYSSVITCTEDAEILFAFEDTVEKLVRTDGDFADAYVRFLSGKIRLLNGKISSYTAKTAADKLYLYIENQPNGVLQNPDMTHVAKALGIGRGSLYRAKDELVSAGLVEESGNDYLVRGEKQ